MTITDDDTVAVTVSETALTVQEQDTTGNAYTVVLESQPTADVTVTVAGHSGTAVTVTPTTPLTFTTMNWDTAQTVTVKAVNDTNTADETVSLTHSATSTDSDYSGITIAGVTVTVEDDDRASTDLIWSTTMTVEVATFDSDAWGYGFHSTGSTYNYGSLDDTTLTLDSTEYFVRHLYAWDDAGTSNDEVYFVIDGAAGPRADAGGLILEWAGAVLSLDTNSGSSTYGSYGTSRKWRVADGKLPSTSPLHPDNIRTTLVPGSTVKACLRTATQFCPDTSVTATVSTDATLSGLTLEDGSTEIGLSPEFVPATGVYTATVYNQTTALTLTAEKNDSNATVVITNDDDSSTPGEGAAGSQCGVQHADGDGDGAERRHEDLYDHGDAGRRPRPPRPTAPPTPTGAPRWGWGTRPRLVCCRCSRSSDTWLTVTLAISCRRRFPMAGPATHRVTGLSVQKTHRRTETRSFPTN